ncbi:MAG TPA: ElyC/SanA/YdcF family protein [Candidatus Paceibacterota bacterium]|nr:ElyC/SanA/YdcF family protein [Candidatus Paceibacterota bacterium]
MKFRHPLDWLRKHRLKIALASGMFAIIGAVGMFSADRACRSAADGRVFRSTADIPQNEVALVLGTGKLTAGGRPNLHFRQRIEAAAALYRSGKVQHLLVSGDNHVKGYDEPSDMRDALVAAGVPTNAITCDYAGFRTLDSIVRANEVFELSRVTIVSEEFHCPRALWIARKHGLDAVAFAAPDLGFRWSAKVKAREALARAWCGIDLYVLHRDPKFTGPREPILLSAR